MKLTEQQLLKINGGAINASLLNALARAFTTTLNIGQIIGSAIRRAISKNYCK